MPSKPHFARIAITLPPDTLRAADELAARQDRSRSWIVAEAIRQYAAAQQDGAEGAAMRGEQAARLDPSRFEQLRRDLALTAEARVLESESIASVGRSHGAPESPRTFTSYDDFLAWRRAHDAR